MNLLNRSKKLHTNKFLFTQYVLYVTISIIFSLLAKPAFALDGQYYIVYGDVKGESCSGETNISLGSGSTYDCTAVHGSSATCNELNDGSGKAACVINCKNRSKSSCSKDSLCKLYDAGAGEDSKCVVDNGTLIVSCGKSSASGNPEQFCYSNQCCIQTGIPGDDADYCKSTTDTSSPSCSEQSGGGSSPPSTKNCGTESCNLTTHVCTGYQAGDTTKGNCALRGGATGEMYCKDLQGKLVNDACASGVCESTGYCKKTTANTTNRCEKEDNDDNGDNIHGGTGDAFKCLPKSPGCSGDYSKSKGDTGVYSCGDSSKVCCYNPTIYDKRAPKPKDKVESDTSKPGGSTPASACDNIDDANTCNATKGCFFYVDRVGLPARCIAGTDADKGVVCATIGFCLKNQKCEKGIGEEVKLKDKYLPGGYYCKDYYPVGGTPPPSYPGPATGQPCAGYKGGVLHYVDATCDQKLYDSTKAKNGDFCGKKYADKYICKNIDPATSTNYEDYFEIAGDKTCSTSSAWCPKDAGPAAVCKNASGTAITCPGGQSCSYDYTKDRVNGPTRCCETGKRWCSVASTCVSESQGCSGLWSGIGQSCTADPDCEDYPKGATCQAPTSGGGGKTCQWPDGKAPTRTPGSPSDDDCKTQIANGRGSLGCACPDGGGCGPGIRGCFPAAQGSLSDNTSWYCSNGAGTWCRASKTEVPNAAACLSATPFSPTATPTDLGYQADCPGNPVGQYKCDSTCTGDYVKNTTKGPGGTTGDKICDEATTKGNICCMKKPVTATTCAYTTTEMCQQEADGSGGWTCLAGWSKLSGKTCTSPAVCCKNDATSGSPGGSPGGTPTDAAGCPSDGVNTCKPNACTSYGLRQNNGAGANAACQNVNPDTGQPYGQYCCR